MKNKIGIITLTLQVIAIVAFVVLVISRSGSGNINYNKNIEHFKHEKDVKINFDNNKTSYDVSYYIWDNGEIVHSHYHYNQRLEDVAFLDSIEKIHIQLLIKLNPKTN